jgi:hypothetical protein
MLALLSREMRRGGSVNPNFDFRDSSVWDDREIQGSVGDELSKFRNLVIGWSTAIPTFLFLTMGCLL